MTTKQRLIPADVVSLATDLNIAIDKHNFDKLQTIECGLHSGYPPCCIAFFLLFWMQYHKDVRDRSDTGEAEFTTAETSCYGYIDLLKKTGGFWGTGYIPCQACYLARRVLLPKACGCKRKDRVAHETGKRAYPFRHEVTPGCVIFKGAERVNTPQTTRGPVGDSGNQHKTGNALASSGGANEHASDSLHPGGDQSHGNAPGDSDQKTDQPTGEPCERCCERVQAFWRLGEGK